jgi:hypothetical protein
MEELSFLNLGMRLMNPDACYNRLQKSSTIVNS